jgi:hypothetical protein
MASSQVVRHHTEKGCVLTVLLLRRPEKPNGPEGPFDQYLLGDGWHYHFLAFDAFVGLAFVAGFVAAGFFFFIAEAFEEVIAADANETMTRRFGSIEWVCRTEHGVGWLSFALVGENDARG